MVVRGAWCDEMRRRTGAALIQEGKYFKMLTLRC